MAIRRGFVYADTHEELLNKIIGFYHDHCYHLYIGEINETPEKYKILLDHDKGAYVFIYDEVLPPDFTMRE